MGGGISSLPRGTQLETVTNSQAPSLISAGGGGYEKKNNNNDDELVEERYFVSVSPECAPSEQKNASPRKPINVLVRDHIQSRVENIVDTAISTIVPETNGETPRVETNNMSPCMRFAQKLISPRRKRKGTMEHLTFADPRCLPPELSSLVTDLKMDSSQSTLSPSSLFRRHWAVDCNLFLGKGSSSVVYKAYPRFKREIRVACKVMDKQRLSLSMARKDKIVRMARNEATLLKRINHPGIASFIACYETPSHIYIIMEECRGGELFEHIIDSSDGLSETDVKVVATQLAGALEYLHARKIMHRDVKPENILLQEPGNLSSVKFIDFGFSRAAEYTRSFLGTAGYVAPEMLLGKGNVRASSNCTKSENGAYTFAVDMWALGVTLYASISGCMPFEESDESDSLHRGVQRIMCQTVEFPDEVFHGISPQCKSCLSRLLQIDPKKRMTAAELLQSSWLRSP